MLLPKKTSADWFLIFTSKPADFSWLCHSCSMSARCSFPAVVVISNAAFLPFFAQVPPCFFQPPAVITSSTLEVFCVYCSKAGT